VKKLPKTINVTLKVWRQHGPEDKGRFETIAAQNISVHMSFIEMLDTVNEQLTLEGKRPMARKKQPHSASFTCENSQTVTPLWWSRSAPGRLRSSKIW
jgi:hypothetical protein